MKSKRETAAPPHPRPSTPPPSSHRWPPPHLTPPGRPPRRRAPRSGKAVGGQRRRRTRSRTHRRRRRITGRGRIVPTRPTAVTAPPAWRKTGGWTAPPPHPRSSSPPTSPHRWPPLHPAPRHQRPWWHAPRRCKAGGGTAPPPRPPPSSPSTSPHRWPPPRRTAGRRRTLLPATDHRDGAAPVVTKGVGDCAAASPAAVYTAAVAAPLAAAASFPTRPTAVAAPPPWWQCGGVTAPPPHPRPCTRPPRLFPGRRSILPCVANCIDGELCQRMGGQAMRNLESGRGCTATGCLVET